MTSRPPLLLALVLLGLSSPGASAQRNPRTLLNEKVELPRLIDLCAQRLKINIQYDATLLKGTLTLRLGAGISDDNLWVLTNRLLAAKGFTTVQMPGEDTVNVVKLAEASAMARVEKEDLDGAIAGYLKVIVRPTYRAAQDVISSLQNVLSPGGKVSSLDSRPGPSRPGSQAPRDGSTGKGPWIMISDLRPHLEQALQIMTMIDTAPEGTVTESIPCRHLKASQLVSALKGLSKSMQEVKDIELKGQVVALPDDQTLLLVAPSSEREVFFDLIDRLDQREAVETKPYRSTRFSVDEISKLISDVMKNNQSGLVLVRDELSGTLFVTGTTAQHASVQEIMDRLDQVPQENVVTESVSTKFVKAQTLATLVERIATTRASVSGRTMAGKLFPLPEGDSVMIVAPKEEVSLFRALIEELDHEEPLETRTYNPSHFAIHDVAKLVKDVGEGTARQGDGRFKVVTDELTATLVVTATAEQHATIAEIIDRLDSSVPGNQQQLRTFTVRNRSAVDLVALLARLIGSGALEGGDVEEGDGVAPPQTSLRDSEDVLPQTEISQDRESGQRIASFVSDRLSLTADDSTNSLIAVAEPRFLSELESLLASLDVREPQVMVEVLVVSLSETDTLNLGIELTRTTSRGDTQYLFASLFGLVGLEADGSLQPGNGDGPSTPSPTGATALVLDPGEYSVLIRALSNLNEGRSLNIPKVLVNNNQEATLHSVLQSPFSSTNASNTVSTTSFGGTQDAGTSIVVRPQIAEGDHMVLDYSVSVSSFVGEPPDTTLPPPRQQNNLQSIATIPDGFAVAVGGLEIEAESEGISKVPLLGDIPLIGEFFTSRTRSSSKSRFFVFIRANVMRHESFEDLKYLSQRELEIAEIEESWPTLEPRWIQ